MADVARLCEWQCLVWRRNFGKLADCNVPEGATPQKFAHGANVFKRLAGKRTSALDRFWPEFGQSCRRFEMVILMQIRSYAVALRKRVT